MTREQAGELAKMFQAFSEEKQSQLSYDDMEVVYLANGQACYLKEKIGDKYIVNKIFEYEQSYEDNSETVVIVGEVGIVVDTIFKTPPIAKFSDEVVRLNKRIEELNNDIELLTSEKIKLINEIGKLKTTKISNDKFILNKTDLINAKTLALFAKDQIMPKTLDSKDKNFRGLKVSMETTISSNEERYWGYKLYFDEGFSSGDYLCPKYGILINPTEKEIEDTIKKRLLEFKFDDYKIARIDDKYLNSSQIEIKNTYLANERIRERGKLVKQLEEIQKKLHNINNLKD